MEDKYNWIMGIIAEYAPKLVLALVTLIIGWMIINWVVRLSGRAMEKSNIDISLRRFLNSLVSSILKLLLILSVANTFGIVTTSFVAIIGAAAFAIGLALQGSLSHFASGVLIMIFKPYKIGDFVETAGKAGTVIEIQIFNTLLTTLNNNMVIVPNGQVMGGPITNYTSLGVRKVSLDFGIGYSDDIDQAKSIIERLFRGHELVLKDKPIEVYVASHGDSSIGLIGRAWVKSEHFWDINFYMMENVKKEFDKEGVGIPFPQMDIHFPDQKRADIPLPKSSES